MSYVCVCASVFHVCVCVHLGETTDWAQFMSLQHTGQGQRDYVRTGVCLVIDHVSLSTSCGCDKV